MTTKSEKKNSKSYCKSNENRKRASFKWLHKKNHIEHHNKQCNTGKSPSPFAWYIVSISMGASRDFPTDSKSKSLLSEQLTIKRLSGQKLENKISFGRLSCCFGAFYDTNRLNWPLIELFKMDSY